jgi:hypothetical protein
MTPHRQQDRLAEVGRLRGVRVLLRGALEELGDRLVDELWDLSRVEHGFEVRAVVPRAHRIGPGPPDVHDRVGRYAVGQRLCGRDAGKREVNGDNDT